MNISDKARLEMDALERAENAEQNGRCQLWERRPGETEKAYSAFRIYRDLAERRTLAKVAQTLGCSSTNVERWARRWFWTNRVYEYDLVEEEKWREQASRDRIAMRRRQIQFGQVLQSIAAYAVQEWRQRIEQKLPHDDRPKLDEIYPKILSMHIARAAAILLCIITELQAYFRFDDDGARINERIQEMWKVLMPVFEVKELYEERYKQLMQDRRIGTRAI